MSKLKELINKPMSLPIGTLIVIADLLLTILIILKVAYTEIDWKAYMEEVEGFLDGERDYTLIRGNTGPLVYPAGFLYIFAFLRFLTNAGTDIIAAQFIFLIIYIANLAVVLGIYGKSQVPCALSLVLVLSKRVHSIYVLRMFNDCIAVLFGYIAVMLFTYRKWVLASIVYSLAVSVKMNMLLYAPGVFVVLLLSTGLVNTIWCIFLCGVVQLVLGLPFLLTYPVSYLTKAFELSRVFMYKWTVNFKFLPEPIFLSKKLSIFLLILTAIFYLLFLKQRLGKSLSDKENRGKVITTGVKNLSNRFIINTLLASNLIGIIFARSLHYQFYCWYFHSIPLILWQSKLPGVVSLLVMALVEVAFNVYPATAWSSAILQISHLILLLAIFTTDIPEEETTTPTTTSTKPEQSKEKAKKI